MKKKPQKKKIAYYERTDPLLLEMQENDVKDSSVSQSSKSLTLDTDKRAIKANEERKAKAESLKKKREEDEEIKKKKDDDEKGNKEKMNNFMTNLAASQAESNNSFKTTMSALNETLLKAFVPVASVQVAPVDFLVKLNSLVDMRKTGMLSEDEFRKAKEKLLNS